ncbi:MAG: hypothetical protein AAGF84_00200 [Planctomycetota bacterium]
MNPGRSMNRWPAAWQRHLRVARIALRRFHRDVRGAATMEYVMTLGVFVMPIAVAMPLLYRMLRHYGQRILQTLELPFP